jgi:periplasmic protein TonB
MRAGPAQQVWSSGVQLTTNRQRAAAAAPVLLIHVGLALLLLNGLRATVEPPRTETIALVDLPPPPQDEEPAPPPPPAQSDGSPQPLRPADPRPEGAASPPNLEARPSPVVAPDPIVPPIADPPVTASPTPRDGFQRSAGAAPVIGPGTGSGGIGDGSGSGRGGSGAGGGGGGGGDGDGWAGASPPRRIRGAISDRDYPAAAGEAGIGGLVEVRYAVETDGRVGECLVERSSGSRVLDDTTCRLIRQRFVFRPARDRRGNAIRSWIVQDHHWDIEDLPPEPERRRRRLF